MQSKYSGKIYLDPLALTELEPELGARDGFVSGQDEIGERCENVAIHGRKTFEIRPETVKCDPPPKR